LCCAAKSCPLVNDCDLLAGFSALSLSAVNPLGLTSSYLVWKGMKKVEWLDYNPVKVAWCSTQSFGHNASTWQTQRQTDSHVAIAHALRRMAKTTAKTHLSTVRLNILLNSSKSSSCQRKTTENNM